MIALAGCSLLGGGPREPTGLESEAGCKSSAAPGVDGLMGTAFAVPSVGLWLLTAVAAARAPRLTPVVTWPLAIVGTASSVTFFVSRHHGLQTYERCEQLAAERDQRLAGAELAAERGDCAPASALDPALCDADRATHDRLFAAELGLARCVPDAIARCARRRPPAPALDSAR